MRREKEEVDKTLQEKSIVIRLETFLDRNWLIRSGFSLGNLRHNGVNDIRSLICRRESEEEEEEEKKEMNDNDDWIRISEQI